MNKKEIARIVKKARKDKGVTYYMLIRDAQVQRKQIMDIENEANYRVDTLCRVLEYLRIRLTATMLQG